uniref:Putative secreted protein n=1 Tax=Anopheles triannulatus TaxID=58253 RepID=A0A2M4B4Z5_9DIPT
MHRGIRGTGSLPVPRQLRPSYAVAVCLACPSACGRHMRHGDTGTARPASASRATSNRHVPRSHATTPYNTDDDRDRRRQRRRRRR